MADRTLTLTMIGRRPGLLTHNPASMSKNGKPPKKGKNIPSPEEEAEAGTYRTEDGACAIPGEAFRRAMIKAAAMWKAPRGRASMMGHMAHILVEEELVELLDPDTDEPLTEYEIDSRRAVVQRQGIIRSRPKFPRWKAVFTIEYDDDLVKEDMIQAIAADAGKRIGFGDYRPERMGPFGRADLLVE